VKEVDKHQYLQELLGYVSFKMTADSRMQRATMGLHQHMLNGGESTLVDWLAYFWDFKTIARNELFQYSADDLPAEKRYAEKNGFNRSMNTVVRNLAMLVVSTWMDLEDNKPICEAGFSAFGVNVGDCEEMNQLEISIRESNPDEMRGLYVFLKSTTNNTNMPPSTRLLLDQVPNAEERFTQLELEARKKLEAKAEKDARKIDPV